MSNNRILMQIILWVCSFAWIAIFFVVFVGPSLADTKKEPRVFPGPYLADVTRVIDADTVQVRAYFWPNQSALVAVRLFGVDTPETRRPKCEEERDQGHLASDFVKQLLPRHTRITLRDVMNGKFAGRVVARIDYHTDDCPKTLADELVQREMAVSYFGGTKTKKWCSSP